MQSYPNRNATTIANAVARELSHAIRRADRDGAALLVSGVEWDAGGLEGIHDTRSRALGLPVRRDEYGGRHAD